MRNVLFLTGALILAFFGLRWAVLTFASDEQKIAWLVARMEDGYNAPRVGKAVSGLAAGWTHEGSRLDKELVRASLAQRVLQEQGRVYPYRARVLDGTLVIEVAPSGERATLLCEAEFERHVGDAWRVVWHARIEARLRPGEDGWEIVESRHEDLEGRRPY